jgi:AraC-like DNA-binding protein
MKQYSLSDLPNIDVNISDISAVCRNWKDGNINRHVQDTPTDNILSLIECGKKKFYKSDNSLICSIEEHSIIFIPAKESYYSKTFVDNPKDTALTTCIRFKLYEGPDLIQIKDRFQIIQPAQYSETRQLFKKAAELYVRPGASKFKLKVAVYELFQKILVARELSIPISEEFSMLLPAIRHIEENPCDNLPVSELAKMCFISESHFRLKFKEYSGGISPTDYRNQLRIRKAKEMVNSSLWTTSMIADVLGFYDTSHFYKVYKKVNGELPRKN